MPLKINFVTTENEKTMKVIEVLRERVGISSRLLRKLKKEKKITVNTHNISLNAHVRVGDTIEITMPTEENIFNPEDINIDVVYEDDHMIIINKQAYLVVHPTKGHPFGTIANGLANLMQNNGHSYKIRFANRLDRDTSGLMIVCKHGYSQKLISDQMIANKVEKKYYAVVEGVIENNEDTINRPIGKLNEDDIARRVIDTGNPSVTHYKVIERFSNATLVEILLETGRTHQIRVHFSDLGHPLIGDELYGGNTEIFNRQALHAFYLKFESVEKKELLHEIDMPEDMKELIEKLRS